MQLRRVLTSMNSRAWIQHYSLSKRKDSSTSVECLWGITYIRFLRYSQFPKKSPIQFTFPITTSHRTSPSCALLWHKVAHEKCPTLVDIVAATAEKFTTVFSLLGRCHSIYDQLFIDELKVTELGKCTGLPNTRTIIIPTSPTEHAISAFMKFIHIFKNATPIKRSHCPLGKADGYRLWSTRRTGGRVYPCPI